MAEIIKIDESDLRRLETDLNKTGEAIEIATGEALEKLLDIIRVDALPHAASFHYIDSWEVKRAAGEHVLSAKDYELFNDSGYGAVIEAGRSDLPNYPKREHVLRALDFWDADDILREEIEDEFDLIFR